MVALLTQLKNEEETIREGGGAKAIESQHKKNRLTARERIARLIDPGHISSSLVFMPPTRCTKNGAARPPPERSPAWPGYAVAMFMIIANDATVKAGAFFPDDREESDPRAEYRHRESHSHHLPGGLGGRFSALAGGCLSGYRRFRPRFSQQRGDERHGHSADHRHHGHVRGRRRLSSGDVRPHSDDRRLRPVPGRAGAGAGGHRPERRRPRNWAARKCTPRSAAPWTFASPTTNPA